MPSAPLPHWLPLAALAASSLSLGCGNPDRTYTTPRITPDDAGAEDASLPPPSFGIDCLPESSTPNPPCPNPTRLAPGENATFPQIVWTGTEYGVVFIANFPITHDIRFARLDAAGNLLSTTVVASGIDVSGTPAVLAWSGSQYGIVWVDGRDGNPELYFARLDAKGALLGKETRLTNAPLLSILPAIVAHESGFAVVWQDERAQVGKNEIYFTRLDPNGVEIGDDTPITLLDGAVSQEPTIAWTGSEYGIAWYDTRDGGDYEIYFTRVSATGTKIGDDIRLTQSAGLSDSPDILAMADGYALCWDDKRDGNMEIYCGKVDPNGAWLDTPERITETAGTSLFPSLAPTRDGLAVAWDDSTCGPYNIYLSALDLSAKKVGPTQALTYQGAAHASLITDGNGLVAAWHDFRYGSEEVLVCRLFQ